MPTLAADECEREMTKLQRFTRWASSESGRDGWLVLALSIPAAVAAVVAVRSGQAAAHWLVAVSVAGMVAGTVVFAVAVLTLVRQRQSCLSGRLMVGSFARGAAWSASRRFDAISVLAAALAALAAASVVLVVPGRSLAAIPITIALTVVLWALVCALGTAADSRGAMERLVPIEALGAALQKLPWTARLSAGWSFAARVRVLARIVAGDPMRYLPAQEVINALEGLPVARPELAEIGPDLPAEANIRARTAGPVLALALPAAIAAWLMAAFLPQAWVPALPSPGEVVSWPGDAPEDAVPPDAAPESPEETGPSPASEGPEPDRGEADPAPGAGRGDGAPQDNARDETTSGDGSEGGAPDTGSPDGAAPGDAGDDSGSASDDTSTETADGTEAEGSDTPGDSMPSDGHAGDVAEGAGAESDAAPGDGDREGGAGDGFGADGAQDSTGPGDIPRSDAASDAATPAEGIEGNGTANREDGLVPDTMIPAAAETADGAAGPEGAGEGASGPPDLPDLATPADPSEPVTDSVLDDDTAGSGEPSPASDRTQVDEIPDLSAPSAEPESAETEGQASEPAILLPPETEPQPGGPLDMGARPGLFAPPGEAPPPIVLPMPGTGRYVSPAPPLPPRQRLPAWIGDLIDPGGAGTLPR